MKCMKFTHVLAGSFILSLVSALGFSEGFSTRAYAQTASSIVQTMEQKRAARDRGLGSYMVVQQTGDIRAVLFYQKDNKSGRFKLVSPTEISTDAANDEGWTPTHTKAMMAGMTAGSELLRQGLNRELGTSGTPADTMMRGGILGMLQMTAGLPDFYSYGQSKYDRDKEVLQEGLDIAKFGDKAELVGTENVGGRTAYHLRADGINQQQKTEEGEFSIDTASMWIDKTEYVPLRIRFQGTAKSGKETQPMIIEKESINYKTVGTMYYPHTEYMRIGGIMNAEQKAEMQKAQAELKKLEEQLKGPQGSMIKQMLGPQLKMLENLSKGRMVEVKTEVIKVTPGVGRETYMAALIKGG